MYPGTNNFQPLESTLMIAPWHDPVVDAVGHDVRSTYVELFWLNVLGPTSMAFKSLSPHLSWPQRVAPPHRLSPRRATSNLVACPQQLVRPVAHGRRRAMPSPDGPGRA